MNIHGKIEEVLASYNSVSITGPSEEEIEHILYHNEYLESAPENWKDVVKKKGAHINPGIDQGIYNNLAKRCPYEIPAILKDFWLQCDGFVIIKNAKKDSHLYPLNASLSLFPMEGAFGGLKQMYKMYETNKKDDLLQWPLLSPELFEEIIEYVYVDPAKVDVEEIFTNAIFLEYFSQDLLCYTMYKMDHASSDRFAQLYLVLEDGPAPLTLTLEEYFEALFAFKGIVFPWPIMFLKEENLDSLVLSQKKEKIEKAKNNAKKLGLSLDVKRFGLE